MDEKLEAVHKRIGELNKKSTQVLLFLSFALIAAASLLRRKPITAESKACLHIAMRFWACAIVPTIFVVLPAKEYRWENPRWYKILQWTKFVLLSLALVLIGCGSYYFLHAI